MTKASENEIVVWQLKYVNEHAGDLSESDLDWADKMQDAFTRQGWLSEKQKEILERIYRSV